MKAIITADWHIRATKPRCRIDENWIETQEKALNQIYEIAVKKHCDVFVVGDIFHSNSDTSFECISIVQSLAQSLYEKGLRMYVLAGNHDLLYHSVENIDKSAIGVLLQSNNIYRISDFDKNNVSAPDFNESVEDKKFVFRHILTFPDAASIPPNVDAVTAKELLKETPSAKFVFVGDNHHNFIFKSKNNRYVINSGCLLRQAVDFVDYVPGVYFVDTEKEQIEFCEIKDDAQLIDDSYIINQKEREERIEKFADKIGDVQSVSLDFIENVKNEIAKNSMKENLKEVIEHLLEV